MTKVRNQEEGTTKAYCYCQCCCHHHVVVVDVTAAADMAAVFGWQLQMAQLLFELVVVVEVTMAETALMKQ